MRWYRMTCFPPPESRKIFEKYVSRNIFSLDWWNWKYRISGHMRKQYPILPYYLWKTPTIFFSSDSPSTIPGYYWNNTIDDNFTPRKTIGYIFKRWLCFSSCCYCWLDNENTRLFTWIRLDSWSREQDCRPVCFMNILCFCWGRYLLWIKKNSLTWFAPV